MQMLLTAFRVLDEYLRVRFGLTTAQYEVLLAIHQFKYPTVGQIARASFKSAGAMTAMLDRLEAQGWVMRERSREDRRSVHVWLVDPVRVESVHTRMQTLLGTSLERMAPDLGAVIRELEAHAKKDAV